MADLSDSPEVGAAAVARMPAAVAAQGAAELRRELAPTRNAVAHQTCFDAYLLAACACFLISSAELAMASAVPFGGASLIDVVGACAVAMAFAAVPACAAAAVGRALVRRGLSWESRAIRCALWFVTILLLGAAVWYAVWRALGSSERRAGAVYLMAPSLVVAWWLSRNARSVGPAPLLLCVALATYLGAHISALDIPPPEVHWGHRLLLAAFFSSLCTAAAVTSGDATVGGRWARAARVGAAAVIVISALVAMFRWSDSFAARDASLRGSLLSRTGYHLFCVLYGDSGALSKLAEVPAAARAPAFAGAPPPADADLGKRLATSMREANVLLLTIDTFRADALGPTLPTLDGIRSESVSFPDATAPSSNTRESFATLMLGDCRVEARRQRTTLAEYMRAAGLTTLAVAPYRGFLEWPIDAGFDRFDRSLLDRPAAERTAGNVVQTLLRSLDEVRGRRFWAWAHFLDPHYPYDSPGDTKQQRYLGDLRSVDRAVGDLLRGLDARGLTRNTAIVITSDHGEEFAEHGGTSHGKTLYEEVLRVPLLVRAPGGQVRGVVPGPAAGVDLMPTLLSLTGVSVDSPGQGVDLLTANPDRAIVSASGQLRLPRDARSRQVAARRGRWKLKVNSSWGAAELYDLATDPGELRNVIDRHRDIAAALAHDLREASCDTR